MKKFLLTLVLMVGIVLGLFAQKLTYQAVIRDNSQQLVVNTDVKATVTITFATGTPNTYEETVEGFTNLHGLLSFEFGGAALLGRDWTGATIAVKVVKANDEGIVYVNDDARPVSAVPYALSVDGQSIQNYLTEHNYVDLDKLNDTLNAYSTTAAMDARHYLTSDSAVITALQSGLSAAIGKEKADSTTLAVRIDALESASMNCNDVKDCIKDTLNHYSTTAAMDARHYLTSDSTVITTMQGNIIANATNITSLQSGLSAAISKEKTDSTTLAGRIDALEGAAMDCNKVKDCIKDTLSKYTVTDQLCNVVNNCDLSANASLNTLLNAINAKMDSLAHLVDSLAKLPHGGDEPATFTCGTSKVKDVDNNEYNTVAIGNQCWMKENLRTMTKRNGVGNIYTENPKAGYNAETYGYYYDWEAVMQNESGDKVQGICPDGWHVPSDAEWDTLTHYVFNSTSPDYKCGEDCGTWQAKSNVNCIAKALASTTGWDSNTSEGCNAGNMGDKANATGFSAVPAGYCLSGDFYVFGSDAYFWSATQYDGDNARYRYMGGHVSRVYWYNDGYKGLGFSVRCLRDAGTGGGGTTPVPVEVSCEQVMECMGDTLGKLNTKIVDLNATVTTQGQKLDSLAHVVDSLAKRIPAMSVTTDSASTVTNNSAKLYGNVTDMGVKTEVNAGFKYGTSESALTSVVGQEAAMTATGSYNCTLTGLTANTQYYFMAFAANGTDTVYGEVKNFTTVAASTDGQPCPGAPTVSDGTNTYNTVKIGNQCWMKENLRTNVGGGVYPKKGDTELTADEQVTYGRLYTWDAMMKGAPSTNYPAGNTAADTIVHGICPAGWHVPSDAEWDTLTHYVYNSANPDYKCSGCSSSGWEQSTPCIAKALSDTTGWDSNTNEGCNAGNTGDKSNLTGFAAVPAGYYYEGEFFFFGLTAHFWSATDFYNLAWQRELNSGGSGVDSGRFVKNTGLSVRCLKDN